MAEEQDTKRGEVSFIEVPVYARRGRHSGYVAVPQLLQAGTSQLRDGRRSDKVIVDASSRCGAGRRRRLWVNRAISRIDIQHLPAADPGYPCVEVFHLPLNDLLPCRGPALKGRPLDCRDPGAIVILHERDRSVANGKVTQGYLAVQRKRAAAEPEAGIAVRSDFGACGRRSFEGGGDYSFSLAKLEVGKGIAAHRPPPDSCKAGAALRSW